MSITGEMQSERLMLVLADISGYTRFVHLHRFSQTHAEVIISELLEEVINAIEPPLELHQLLGDAAVFFARSDESPQMAHDVFAQVRRATDRFRTRAAEVTGECRLCACGACRDAGQLRLKVIVHHGDAVVTQQRGIAKLAGEDVIVAHRLLKNTVTADEYVLITEPFARLLGDLPGPRAGTSARAVRWRRWHRRRRLLPRRTTAAGVRGPHPPRPSGAADGRAHRQADRHAHAARGGAGSRRTARAGRAGRCIGADRLRARADRGSC